MINERITTCINLFNSYNEIEEFLNKTIKIAKELENLSETELNKYITARSSITFTEEDKKSAWYKLYEETINTEKPSSDYFQKIAISLSALFISLHKELIIEKDSSKNLSILVNEQSYKEILNHFCTKKDNKYYIDELEFNSPLECLDFIRNKLLHGDYYIKDDYIYIKKDNKAGKIRFTKLINYCLIISDLSKCKNKTYEDSMVLCSPYTGGALTPLTTITERMYYVDLKFTVKGSRTINMDIINLAKEIEDLAHYYNMEHNMFVGDAIAEAIKDKEDVLRQNKCTVDYHIDYYIRKPNAKEVIEKFIKEYKKEKNKKDISLNDIVNYLTTNTFVDKRNVLNESFKSLTYQLLRFMPNAVGNTIRHDAPDDWFNEIYGASLPMNILKFYCYYNYGLDKIYSSGSDTLLRDILEGRKFDYSKLDLTLFDDPGMKEDITINNYNDQLMGITNEYNKKETSYKNALNNYNNFIAKAGTSNPLVEAKLLSICQTHKKSFDEIKDLKDKADNFDLNKYVKNLNIINHLRNSIAHGNYELDDSDIENRYFIFKDIYNGVNTYTLKIKCEDFVKLFNSKNKIHDYLENLSVNYLGKNMERIHREELLLDCNYVKEGSMTNWNSLVETTLNSGDEQEIKKILLAYNCMKEIYAPSLYITSEEKYKQAVGVTISRIFSYSTINFEEDKGIKIFDEVITISEYEEIIRNIITYFKGMDTYESFIEDSLLPISEEGSILDKIYNKKSKVR